MVRLRLGSSTVVLMRVYYSSYHLWAARHYGEEARRRELELMARPVFDWRHRAHVTSAILSSVAFLEAAINEIFQDAVDGQPPYLDPLTPEARNALAGFWEADVERKFSVLEKYQMALCLLQEARFSRGAPPFKGVALLIRLRNELVHFKPQTRAQTSVHKLQSALESQFDENPLMAGSGPYFPDRCLGSECALWAGKTAITFTDAFFQRVGLSPNYQRLGIASVADV